jgi:hypothetical protein
MMFHPDKCDCRDCRPDLYFSSDDIATTFSKRPHRSDWQRDYEDERTEEYLEIMDWIEAEEQAYRSEWLAASQEWVEENGSKLS